ncbi:hypothetical protein CBR_g24363 [Chara braunii]|uniref:Peptidase C14 caspase domain-containing protein n=1 Tax=Chara braunii TaxID=69332 RepID=A0A388JMN6_CHABU|nr:hypothetical protein CBR_g24363 [Chara braunii]|eukprot:GBG59015.1 hypothetical protein CBR_g24363 [Chara braunii]
MVKRAVLVGCNYANTNAALNGCINDVSIIYQILTERYGFSADDITILIDSRNPLPTGKNIKAALLRMVKSAVPGDVLFFHFSGHGVQVPSEDPKWIEKDGKDECIVPCDFNLIVDHDLKTIINQVPQGARFTMISDCCHSGTMLDGENVEIEGPKEDKRPGLISMLISAAVGQGRNFDLEADDLVVENRSLPLHVLEDVLRQKTGHDVNRGGNIHASLAELFGKDASKTSRKIRRIFTRIDSKLSEKFGKLFSGGDGKKTKRRGLFGSALGFVQDAFSGDSNTSAPPPPSSCASGYGGPADEESYYAHGYFDAAADAVEGHDDDDDDDDDDDAAKPQVPIEVPVLVTGCQSHETSADACPSGDKSKAFGALTNAISNVLAAYPNGLSNRDLVMNVRELLKSQRFPQNPCLECASPNAHVPFIC